LSDLVFLIIFVAHQEMAHGAVWHYTFTRVSIMRMIAWRFFDT